MAFTDADLQTLRTAIASGVLRVRYADGREVGYQSIEAMLKAEQRIMEGVAAAKPAGRRSRRQTPGYRNGC